RRGYHGEFVLAARALEVMAGQNEEGVQPHGHEELRQPGQDVTSRQAQRKLSHDPRADEPEFGPERTPYERHVARRVRPATLEPGDLPRPQRQPSHGYPKFVEGITRNPEYRMQPEHAVEERLLHIRPGAQIRMVQ